MSKEIRKRQRQVRREKTHAQGSRYQWIGLGALALILIAAVSFISSGSKAQPLDETRLASNPTLGPDSAKVVITEYGDFGCSSCRGWHNAGIMEQIMAMYGDQVQFVWKDFPVITTESPKAAEAGQCAFDQGKFWEYHDFLYEETYSLYEDDLKSYATQLGLDKEQFNQCLDSGQNRAKVEQSLNEALREYAFPGTPSFLVNGKKLIGPPTFEVLKSTIDSILAGG
ncbi:MAG: DsbA family protein [Anaerolineae bacterium]|nr:DsbA family protein [Anaerolineae bacterium]MCI0608337.1 DsbA family protein [Anaerolineae bacterium]